MCDSSNNQENKFFCQYFNTTNIHTLDVWELYIYIQNKQNLYRNNHVYIWKNIYTHWAIVIYKTWKTIKI